LGSDDEDALIVTSDKKEFSTKRKSLQSIKQNAIFSGDGTP
jgi:hypothetical protein